MDQRLQEFFFYEVDHRHLNFEEFPEYNSLMTQSLALFPDGDLPKPIFELLETTNRISFAHRLKLGLNLKQWSQSLPL